MSKQYKKLQQKLHPKVKKNAAQEKPVGKDYLLLIVIGFILVLTIGAWEYMNNLSRSMYILLGISMTCNYLQRHAKVSEQTIVIISRVGLATIALAIVLFLVSLYYQFVA